MVDWKHYVRTYPWVCLGTAAVLGFLIVPRRSTAVRVLASLAELAKTGHPVVKPAPAATRGLVDAIAATVANIAIRGATAYVGQSAGRLLGIATSRSAPPAARRRFGSRRSVCLRLPRGHLGEAFMIRTASIESANKRPRPILTSGSTVVSGSRWPEKNWHSVSGPSSGLSPNSQCSAWGRQYPSESHLDGG